MNIGIGILISADSRYILNTQLNIRLTIKSQAHKEVNEKYFRPAPPPLTNSRQMRNLLAARAKEGIANKAQHRPRPTSIAFGCFGLSRVRCAGSAVMRGWLRLRRE